MRQTHSRSPSATCIRGVSRTISRLSGEIAGKGDGSLVVDVGGVGYEVRVPAPLLDEVGDSGKIRLYTHLAVREDALTLYGFSRPEDLSLFRLLIGVTRVGPQLALQILSQTTARALADAIALGDEKALTRIQGVGQKNARRLILELRDRVAEIAAGSSSPSGQEGSRSREDAIAALVSLGFNPRDAALAVEQAAGGRTGTTAEALVKAALLVLRGP